MVRTQRIQVFKDEVVEAYVWDVGYNTKAKLVEMDLRNVVKADVEVEVTYVKGTELQGWDGNSVGLYLRVANTAIWPENPLILDPTLTKGTTARTSLDVTSVIADVTEVRVGHFTTLGFWSDTRWTVYLLVVTEEGGNGGEDDLGVLPYVVAGVGVFLMMLANTRTGGRR